MVRGQSGSRCVESAAAPQFSQLRCGHLGTARLRGIAGTRRPPLEEFREMILAGDIGGTHARLAFFDVTNGSFRLVSSAVFPSRDFSGLDQIVTKFVEGSHFRPDIACFGVAGPVRNGKVETSNLPWGIAVLGPGDVVALNQVNGHAVGNQAVISAGTGLGEAGMYWDGRQHHVFACEGGHSDFAARNELEMDLLRYLQKRFGHVSYERAV